MDILSFLLGLFFIVLAIIFNLFIRTPLNPATIFSVLWGVILGLYSFNFYNFYHASNKCIYLIAIGTISYVFGVFIYRVFSGNGISRRIVPIEIDINKIRPNYSLMTILNLVCIIYFFAAIFQTILLLKQGQTYEYIHSFYMSEESEIGSSLGSRILLYWLIWPITLAITPMLVTSLQCDKFKSRKKKYFIATSIINLCSYIFVTGARMTLAYFLVFYFIVFFLIGRKISIDLKKIIIFFLFTVIFASAFNYISMSRGHTSIIKTVYVYLCGCVPYLSERLSSDGYNHTYGGLSLYGFYKPVLSVITRLFSTNQLRNYKYYIETIIHNTQNRISIGPEQTFNAFLTPFYYFYIDGGFTLTIVFSFIYGVISTLFFKNLIINRDGKSMCMYLLILEGIIFSMVRFHFVQVRYVISFFIIIIAYGKRPKKFRLKL